MANLTLNQTLAASSSTTDAIFIDDTPPMSPASTAAGPAPGRQARAAAAAAAEDNISSVGTQEQMLQQIASMRKPYLPIECFNFADYQQFAGDFVLI
jgi:hypothetical protein